MFDKGQKQSSTLSCDSSYFLMTFVHILCQFVGCSHKGDSIIDFGPRSPWFESHLCVMTLSKTHFHCSTCIYVRVHMFLVICNKNSTERMLLVENESDYEIKVIIVVICITYRLYIFSLTLPSQTIMRFSLKPRRSCQARQRPWGRGSVWRSHCVPPRGTQWCWRCGLSAWTAASVTTLQNHHIRPTIG